MSENRILRFTPSVVDLDSVDALIEDVQTALYRDEKARPAFLYEALNGYWGNALYDEDLERAAWKYHKSEFFAQLSPAEKALAIKAFTMSETAYWSAAIQDDNGDWRREDESAIPAHPYEQLILSGAIGAELVTHFPQLERHLPKDVTPLSAVVELGGFAVTGAQSCFGPIQSDLDSTDYRFDSKEKGRSFVTRIGADIHGDFRTTRETMPLTLAVDPLGRLQKFGPAESTTVSAYHSDEGRILTELLRYELLYRRVNPSDLYDRLVNQFNTTSGQNFGANLYGDFGYNSGEYEKSILISQIEEKESGASLDVGAVLCNLTVMPGNWDYSFQIVVRANGLEFRNYTGDTTVHSFTIASEEVETYIATLLSETHGRTSLQSLRNIISALDVARPEAK